MPLPIPTAPFDVSGGGQGEPASNGFIITPDDNIALPYITRGIYSGAGGNINVKLLGNQILVFNSVPAGQILPIRVKQVFFTSTTATGLLGLY